MKRLILPLASFFFCFALMAQNQMLYQPQQISAFTQQAPAAKKSKNLMKGPSQNVVYSEDFDFNQPYTWTVTSLSGNCSWSYDTTYLGGQLTSGIPRINSTTGANGFISLEMDLCNTPIPPGGAVSMDEIISSPAITVPSMNAVYVRFEQYLTYCCNTGNEIVLECSTNGSSWTTYDLKVGLNPNTQTPNAETKVINVSTALAGATTAYLRFRATGSTHYFWMIDDVEIVEGKDTSLLMQDFRMVFSRNHQYNPTYSIVPQKILEPVEFEADVLNDGFVVQTGATATVNIYHDSSWAGGAGSGLVQSVSSTFPNSISSQVTETITVNNPPYTNFINGFLRIEANLNSAIGTGSNNLTTRRFAVSDSVFARDDGGFGGSAGPANYVGGGQDNDNWGVLYEMLGDSGMATTISIYVSTDSAIIGSAISPRIWPFDDAQATLNGAIGIPIGSSPFSRTISAQDIGSWIHLELFPPVMLKQDSQYVVGWEQTGGGFQNDNFRAGRDISSEATAPLITNFAFLNEPGNPRWIATPQVAGVRLNLGAGNFTVGLEDQAKMNSPNFSLQPNPAVDRLRINIDDPHALKTEVRNKKGQIVYEEWIGGKKWLEMNVEHYKKGIYFVTVVSEDGTKTLKLIIL